MNSEGFTEATEMVLPYELPTLYTSRWQAVWPILIWLALIAAAGLLVIVNLRNIQNRRSGGKI